MTGCFKKITAVVTLSIYLFSGQGFAFEPAARMPALPDSGAYARRLAQAPVSLPPELGKIETFIPAAQPSKNLPAILHLQTAHGDYAAQEALVRVLDFLQTAYGPKLFFLEGAAGDLEPGLDRFFTEAEWNESFGRFRMKKGRMSGASFFLMNHPDKSFSVYGMESAEAYRKNRGQFLRLLQNRTKAEALLERLSHEIDGLFMRQAAKELTEFRRNRQAFEAHERDLLGWALQLKKMASEHLGLDLEHVSSQKDWPALLRLFWLKEFSPPSAAQVPESLAALADSSQGFHYGELRLRLEQRNQKDGLEKLDPADRQTLKSLVLQNELRAGDLWEEIKKLSALLMQTMAGTAQEKRLLQLDEKFLLLKSLLRAELSADEYAAILREGDSLRPSRAFKDMKASDSWDELERLFDEALSFYQGAKAREAFMADSILEQPGLREAGPLAVIITGGFHAEGLRRELTGRGFAYTQMTPVNAHAPEGLTAPAEDPHALYRQIFMDHSRTAEAHIEDAVVLPVPRQGVEKLGISLPDFTASRTEAAEEWLRTEFRGDRVEAVRQFNQSLFAQSFDVQLAGRRSEVRSQPAEFSSGLSRDIREASRVIRRLFARLPQDARVSEFARTRALLTALYGGTVQVWVERHVKESRWEKQDYKFERGLMAYDAALDERLPQLRDAAEDYLLQQGIRPFQELVLASGRRISIGEILTHELRYQNPFLHTFLGGTRSDGLRSPVYSRYEKARDFSDNFPLRQPVTDEEWNALRQFDTVFIPAVSMEASDPFVVRVQHNRVRGPYKGGIRMVRADTLRHDAHFMRLVDELKDHLTLEEMRFFLRKYILEETLPLAFGMTSKTAVAGIAYGGGKGTMLGADFYREENGSLIIRNNGEDQGGSEVYRQRLARNFARVLQQSGIAHEERDIPAADLNSGPYMDIMADEHLEALLEQMERRDHLRHAENALEHSAQRLRSKLHGSGSAEDTALLRGFLEDRRLIADLRKIRQSQFNAESLKDAKYLEVLTVYLRKLQTSKRPVPDWVRPLVRATAVYTSKKESLSGSAFRPESTGYGGIHVVKEVVRVEMPDRDAQRPLEGLSAKLMGFGAVGAPAAEKMLAEGVLLKMISLGPQGGIVKEAGLTADDLATLKKLFGQTGGFSLLGTTGYEIDGARYVEPADVDEQLLVLDADMFVLAAVENAIHEGNVGRANGKIFVELANGAITNKAFEQLLSGKSLVIPDTLANAGGVIVSYFEWQQNLNNERWSREKVIREMEKLLSRGVEQTHAMRTRLNTDWRTAADAVMATEVFIKMRQHKKARDQRRSEIREILSPVQVNLAMRFFLASLGYNTNYHLPSVPDIYEEGGGLLDVSLEEFLGFLNQPVQRGEVMQMHVANVFHAVSKSRAEKLLAHHFHGKTIGLVGFGLQTREFARRLNLLRETSKVEFTILATSPELERRDAEMVRLADELRVLYPGTQAVLAQSDTLSFDDQYAASPEVIKLEQMPKAQVLLNFSEQPLLTMQDWRRFFQKPGTLYFAQMDLAAADDAVRDTLMLRLFHPSQAIVLPQFPAAETRNGDDYALRSEVRSFNQVELAQTMIQHFQDGFGAMDPALYQAQVLPGFPDGITVNLYPAGELRGLLEKTDLNAELDLIQVPYGSLGQIKVSLIEVNGAPAFFIETIHPSHAYRKVVAEQPDLLKHHTDWQDRLVSRVLEISNRMDGIPVFAKSPALAEIQNPEMGHGRARRYYHLLFRNDFRKAQVRWRNYFYTDQEVEQITRSEKEIYGKERYYAGGEHELWRYDAHAWVNTSTRDPHPLPLRLFRSTAQNLQKVIHRTPLLELVVAGQITQKKVFLKNESGQVGRAFKYRGVYAEVLEAIEKVLNEPDSGRSKLAEGVKIVTQSTGNHGIALIYATADIILGLREQYAADSQLTALFNTIEPVVFTLKNLPEVKYDEMQRALEYYRQVTGTQAGVIRNEFKDYAKALEARETYIAENASVRFYMEHGGKMIMLGHGSAGLEIVDQLREAGITDDQKVVVLLPVGAGGPVGIGAAAKEARPNTQVVLVQSERRDAFVRSLKSGKLEKNAENISPTAVLRKNGEPHPVIFPDGIDVDAPEPYGLEMARIYADAAVAVDEVSAFHQAGPALVYELNGHGEMIAGGTTALTLQALFDWGTQLETIRDADVVVLFGTEGNVDPVVTHYLQLQATLAPGIFENYRKKFERRSEVRAGALSPEEITRARVVEIFSLRDRLLNLFSQLKAARQTAGAEVRSRPTDGTTRVSLPPAGADVSTYFRQARRHVPALDAFIQEIRSGNAEEAQILQAYTVLSAGQLKEEAVSLGRTIQAMTPLFIEQYRRYNTAGKNKNAAEKAAANQELDRLNQEVVRLAKRRLKIQLLRLRAALSSEPVHQGTVFTLLISITDLYHRIAHEYFWRSFRQGVPAQRRILTVDPFGSVSDNLAYETPAVFRVEQAEEGKIKITQIVWKWMPVENGPDALTPVLTAMEFDDPGVAYRGKSHALDSQQMDHAVLTQYDHALQSLVDVLRWYVNASETPDEELRSQLLETIEDVLTGPGGKSGLRLKIARTTRDGQRARKQNVLPRPREKLELAQTLIQNGELRQAIEAIQSAQEWTRARRRDIENSTVPATVRKRNYAYFLMRDAQILSLLKQAREELLTPAKTVKEAGHLQAVAREKAGALEELYQVFFRFVVPESPQQPEVRLYRQLQSQLRLYVSSLRALESAFQRNQLASARSTAAGLNQRVSALMEELGRIQQERKMELRSEVRAFDNVSTPDERTRSEVRALRRAEADALFHVVSVGLGDLRHQLDVGGYNLPMIPARSAFRIESGRISLATNLDPDDKRRGTIAYEAFLNQDNRDILKKVFERIQQHWPAAGMIDVYFEESEEFSMINVWSAASRILQILDAMSGGQQPDFSALKIRRSSVAINGEYTLVGLRPDYLRGIPLRSLGMAIRSLVQHLSKQTSAPQQIRVLDETWQDMTVTIEEGSIGDVNKLARAAVAYFQDLADSSVVPLNGTSPVPLRFELYWKDGAIRIRSEVRSSLSAEDQKLAVKIADAYHRERILAARSLARGYEGDIGGGRELLQDVKSLGVDAGEDAVRVQEILSSALDIQQERQRRSEVRGKPSKKEKRKEEKRRQKEEAGLRWYQRWFLRFEQKLPEKVAGLDRRTFLAVTAGTAGLFLAGWSAKTYLTSAEPWEELPSGEGYSFAERQSAVRQALLDAVDWMIENNYPAPGVLQQYRAALEEARESPENNTWFLGKVAEGDHFENRYVMITTERMWRLMGAIKAAGSSDMYVEYLAALIVREAWGFKMLHELSERFPGFAAKVNRLGSGFDRLRQNVKEGPFFFAVEEKAVIEAAAEGIIYEFYETLRHREALQWFEQRSLYSKEKIQKQYESLKNLVDRETYARATTVRRLTGRLQDERSGLYEILTAELAHHLPRGFLRIGQDMTFTALGIYAVMETVRWGLTRGEDGIATATLQAGPQQLEGPEYLESYHHAAERLYVPVTRLIGEIESTLPASERIAGQFSDDHQSKELPTIQQAIEDFTRENPGVLRSEVRAKKASASKARGFGEKTVLAEIAAIQNDLDMSDLGGRDRDEFVEHLRAAESAFKRQDLDLVVRMHSSASSLNLAALTIQSIHTKTIDALHKRVTALRKKIDAEYPESPGEASKPGPKPKKRSEVRVSQATLAVAQLLDGLFLPEDLAQAETWPAARPYLTAPSWRMDLDAVAGLAASNIRGKAASGSWQERFPGDLLRGRDKQAYLIGPELVRRYGPVLFALEQAVSNTSRMIVVASSEEEGLRLKPLVDAVNAQLPKSRQVMIKTPAQARALLKADTLRGLGLEGVDAALLRQLIPDFMPLNGFELDRWIDQAPGLTALVQKFRALAALAAAA